MLKSISRERVPKKGQGNDVRNIFKLHRVSPTKIQQNDGALNVPRWEMCSESTWCTWYVSTHQTSSIY